jgi:hypothetical protein
MPALERQWCAQHSDRPSHALCMSCRKTLCQECASEFEGIYYCLQCVARRAPSPERRSGLFGLIATLFLAAALAFAVIRLAVGIGAFVAGLS